MNTFGRSRRYDQIPRRLQSNRWLDGLSETQMSRSVPRNLSARRE
jgi:hypothetical protein